MFADTSFDLFAPTATDGYKIGHRPLYPDGTNLTYSNGTFRSDRIFLNDKSLSRFWDSKVVWVGIQGALREIHGLWKRSFFDKPKEAVVKRYARRMKHYLGDGRVNSECFEKLHDLGYLPIQVLSIKEGSRVNMNVPAYTVYNTHPDFYWVVNYLETIMSAIIWKIATNATIAYEYRRTLDFWAKETGVDSAFVDVQGHDFSFRGMSGPEDAARCGLGHLVAFKGTDTLPAIDYAEDMYFADVENEFVAASVVATEHAVATSNILFNVSKLLKAMPKNYGLNNKVDVAALRTQGELQFIREVLTVKNPTGIISLVSDSFDFWKVLTEVIPALKEEILARQPDSTGLAKTVIRPDCYSSDTSILTPNGWKLFTDLTDDDLVAQVKDDGSYEFIKPLKIINQEYSGPMQYFQDHHGKVDLIVTPNHRMILEQGSKLSGNWVERVIEAEKIGGSGHHLQRMNRSARAPNKEKSLTAMERLNIAFQADGSYSTGVSSSVRFSFSKKRKIERMMYLLDLAGLEYKIYDLGDGKSEFNIKVNKEFLIKDFSWVDTSDLCSNWSKEFIDELSHWDATIRNEGRIKFDTTNQSVSEVVELIAISAGYAPLTTEYADPRSGKFNNIFSTHILKDNKIGGQAWRNKTIDYKGTVHCVTVPTGRVLVKRNRSILVSGNSGDPVKVICGSAFEVKDLTEENLISAYKAGYKYIYCQTPFGEYHEILISGKATDDTKELYYLKSVEPTPEMKGAVQCLWETFGGTRTSKNYKVLHERVSLIYGDSITVKRADEILRRLAMRGFASSNVVFGIGSYTYQYNSRDTLAFAIKATVVGVEDEIIELFKAPKTEGETVKKSAKGFLKVIKDESGNFILEQEQAMTLDSLPTSSGELKPIYRDGVFQAEISLKEITETLFA